MGTTTKIIKIRIASAISALLLLSGCYNLFYPNNSIINHSEIKFDRPLVDSTKILFNGEYTNIEGYSYYFYKDKSVIATFSLDSTQYDMIYGTYDIINDTIKVAIYYQAGIPLIPHIGGCFIYFIIKNQQTLDCQYCECIELNDISYYISTPPNSLYLFKPISSKPIADGSFIRKKKWMWENKEDWKQWKEEQKRLKKERKLKSKGQTKQKYDPYAPDMNRGRDNQSIN